MTAAAHLNHARAALAHYEATTGETGPPWEWVEESVLAFHLWSQSFFIQPEYAEERRQRYLHFRGRLPERLGKDIFQHNRREARDE